MNGGVVMLFLISNNIILILLLINQNNFQIDQVNYYYFTADYCVPCKKQLPIIIKLKKEGFNFEIIDDPELFDHYNVNAFPTIIIELIDYKKKEVKQIRLIGLQSYSDLKRIIFKNKTKYD